jgi:hypothetical protein
VRPTTIAGAGIVNTLSGRPLWLLALVGVWMTGVITVAGWLWVYLAFFTGGAVLSATPLVYVVGAALIASGLFPYVLAQYWAHATTPSRVEMLKSTFLGAAVWANFVPRSTRNYFAVSSTEINGPARLRANGFVVFGRSDFDFWQLDGSALKLTSSMPRSSVIDVRAAWFRSFWGARRGVELLLRSPSGETWIQIVPRESRAIPREDFASEVETYVRGWALAPENAPRLSPPIEG